MSHEGLREIQAELVGYVTVIPLEDDVDGHSELYNDIILIVFEDLDSRSFYVSWSENDLPTICFHS